MKRILAIAFSVGAMCLLLFSCVPEDNVKVVYYDEKTVVVDTAHSIDTEAVNVFDTMETTVAEEETSAELSDESVVYISPSGKKYHLKDTCAGKNAIATTLKEIASTKTACKRCVK